MPALEDVLFQVKKRCFMGPFVAGSNTCLEGLIDSAIADIPKSARVGIFGVGDFANTFARHLKRRGVKNVYFVASNPLRKFQESRDLIDIESAAAMEAEYMFVASLARPEELADALRLKGFKGNIIALPALKHLSTVLSEDPSTIRRIRSLRGRHAGRPAFIIGSAPSLNTTHPGAIGNRAVTLTANGAIRIGNFTPDYYFLLDVNAVRSWVDDIAGLDSTVLMASHLGSLYGQYPGLRRPTNILFPTCYERDDALDVDLWEEKGFETGHTVVCPMFQFALLMGCNPIYLIGVDLTYGTTGSYFTENYHAHGVPKYRADQIDGLRRRLYSGIERSAEACKRRGVDVYNCSPCKSLAFLENRDYSTIIDSLNGDAR